MWYFLSFSYSSVAKRAVAFLARYGAGGLVRRKAIPCLHAPPFFLHLVIGGRHLERYSGINGQFANIFYDVDAPALIDTEEQLH
jgi:hypothetical protein